jgi:hypothetical protein
MLRNLAMAKVIEVPCAQEAALAVIWRLDQVLQAEVKVDAIEVHPVTDHSGTYALRGRFAGLPWRDEFSYVLHAGGFHSVQAQYPASGPRIQGGFVVIATGAQQCTILHYEQYVLPRWAVLLKPIIAAYLSWSMHKELRDLRQMLVGRPAATMLHP